MTVLIFGYVLLVSSVCVESVSSASYPCTLKVFEEQSADHIEDLCLDEFSDTDCRPFLKHFNRSDLPGGFSLRNDDCSVQRPESLDFTPSNSKYHDNEQEYTKPAAYVDWVSPVACLSRKHIKGYLLTWEMSAEVKCRFFKFNASRTDLLRKQVLAIKL
ncbi:hypothetical protein RRG08_020815 [Elysia crispata]|uniref:Uncharacterized protein n=1 Tax=Elysia crispata TaxID=231223 RepID=A0AAE0YQL5_9GAST|nr:hypothetical protein RRG08_020815 [Elysia crispata]